MIENIESICLDIEIILLLFVCKESSFGDILTVLLLIQCFIANMIKVIIEITEIMPGIKYFITYKEELVSGL